MGIAHIQHQRARQAGAHAHFASVQKFHNPGFGGQVFTHVGVVVEVVAAQIGHHGHIQAQACGALLVQGMGRQFHGHAAAIVLHHAA